MHRTTPLCAISIVACLGLTAPLAGCGSGRFGSDLSARPAPRPIQPNDGDSLRLPRDASFSIVLPQASKKPGLDGTAEADAEATGAGDAMATVAVTHSGEALGLFQLGHAFKNDTDRQVDLEVAVQLNYSFEATADPESGYPDATVGLRLYARDVHGRMLRDLEFVEHSTENGPAASKGDEQARFTLTLGPGQAVDVFVAGQAKAEIRAGRSATGSLKLSDLQMEVTTRPAPPVRAVDDEQR